MRHSQLESLSHALLETLHASALFDDAEALCADVVAHHADVARDVGFHAREAFEGAKLSTLLDAAGYRTRMERSFVAARGA